MERIILFSMLLLCSSVALFAAPHHTKYRQLTKTIDLVERRMKDKDVELLHTPENPVDECLSTAVTCFKKGILKLQLDNATLTHADKVFKGFTISNHGKHCESSCESYKKKTPKEFLESFRKLIQKVIRTDSS
ncbi:IL21 protein, partial [Brachypteracias leptosomus]|nr:IL21 protein [Brachypteracias leptosomus]